jgi:hypothetical protein
MVSYLTTALVDVGFFIFGRDGARHYPIVPAFYACRASWADLGAFAGNPAPARLRL